MALQARVNLVTQSIKSDAGTVTAYGFDVENTSDGPITVGIEPLGESKDWIKLVKRDDAELELPARAVQRVSVNITVPADASAKRYSFKLRIYDARTPTLAAESGAIALEVTVPTQPQPQSRPTPTPTQQPARNWLPIIIAASVGGVVLIGGIVGLLVWLSGASGSVPNLIGMTAADAVDALQDNDYEAPVIREEVTGEQQPGRVARQSPEAGADKPGDGVVTLVVEATPSAPTPPPRKHASLVGDWLGAPDCTLVVRVDDGKDLEGYCDAPDVRHQIAGVYQPEDRIEITITRVHLQSRCTTTAEGYIRIENDDTIEVSQDGWNDCGVRTGPAMTSLQRSAGGRVQAPPSPPSPPLRKYASLVGRWLGAPDCTFVVRVDDGKAVAGDCDSRDVRHQFAGVYQTEDRIEITITRAVPQCRTTVQGYVRVENDDTIEVSQDGWNDCGVTTGPARTRLQRRR